VGPIAASAIQNAQTVPALARTSASPVWPTVTQLAESVHVERLGAVATARSILGSVTHSVKGVMARAARTVCSVSSMLIETRVVLASVMVSGPAQTVQ
jgi:hypothetical protein